MTEACHLVPPPFCAAVRGALTLGLLCLVACVDAIAPEDAGVSHDDAAVTQGDAGPVAVDAGSVRDAAVPVDSGPYEAGAGPHEAGVDAQPPGDSGPIADGAVCATIDPTRGYELFVFDSHGPTALIGAWSASTRVVHEFNGIVTQQGQGFPIQAAPSGTPQPEQPEQFRYLRLSNAEGSWTIALRHAAGFGVRDGAQVEVKAGYEWGGFSPVQSSLSIRVDGQLALFYARGGRLNSLPFPPELEVRELAAVCTRHDQCGSWASYSISVSSSRQPPHVFAPGEQKQLGPFTVTHARDDQQLPSSGGGCADWFVSHAELMAVRSEPLGPAGGDCRIESTSTLPGVRIEFPAVVPCRFSLAQAAAGIDIPYALVVDTDVGGVVRAPTAVSACAPNPPQPDLFVLEDLSGNGHRYALLDFGLCPPRPDTPVTLRAGRYEHIFHWDGVNWSGPSDTGQPKGPPFPAGVYTLRLSARGERAISDAAPGRDYEVAGTLQLTLTP